MPTPQAQPTRRARAVSPAEAQQLCEAHGVTQTVDTNQAAAMSGYAPQTLRRWACYGDGPIRPNRVNGRLRWPVDEIRKLMAGAAA